MLLEPNVVVLYVNHLETTSDFYKNLLGMAPAETSPTFHAFILSNGMTLGLKVKHSVEPPVEQENGSGELAFIVESNKKVDELFLAWQQKNIHILLKPSTISFGYTFVALDPDGNRLRVVSVRKSA